MLVILFSVWLSGKGLGYFSIILFIVFGVIMMLVFVCLEYFGGDYFVIGLLISIILLIVIFIVYLSIVIFLLMFKDDMGNWIVW